MAALDSLLGNETLKESLSAALAAGRLSHSILLCGEGVSGDIRVDRVREVRREIFNTALSAGGRAVHIKGADKLNGASANALLKVLEEPPEGVLFIPVSYTHLAAAWAARPSVHSAQARGTR